MSQSEWDRLLEAAGDFRVITNDGCIDQDGFDPDLVSSLGWLPLVSLMIYVIFFSIGKYFKLKNWLDFDHDSV